MGWPNKTHRGDTMTNRLFRNLAHVAYPLLVANAAFIAGILMFEIYSRIF
jgi:hypothetical protein